MSLQDYKAKVRVRVNGLLFEDDKLLLIQLHSPVKDRLIWMPPGGGVDFGETLHQAVEREFHEETGLVVSASEILHVHELIAEEFHAIEFYFHVEKTGGSLNLGADPEHSSEEQILSNVKFFSEAEIRGLEVAPEFIREEIWLQKKSGFSGTCSRSIIHI